MELLEFKHKLEDSRINVEELEIFDDGPSIFDYFINKPVQISIVISWWVTLNAKDTPLDHLIEIITNSFSDSSICKISDETEDQKQFITVVFTTKLLNLKAS